MNKRNAIVAQSGGPSPVINASLLGVLEGCRDFPDHIDKVYAAWHGVEGILLEELIDMGRQDPQEIRLLRTTTSAGAVGTCRYKLTDAQAEDFRRIIEVMQAHDVGYFFYIGGNDSMDTAHKVSQLAIQRGVELIATGVPKTIDNDIWGTDITFGFDSAMGAATEAIDKIHSTAMSHHRVMVVEVMGRYAGWLALESGKALGRKLVTIAAGGGSDANIFGEKGIQMAVMGTGMNKVHTKDEYLIISDMVKSAELLLKIIELEISL